MHVPVLFLGSRLVVAIMMLTLLSVSCGFICLHPYSYYYQYVTMKFFLKMTKMQASLPWWCSLL